MNIVAMQRRRDIEEFTSGQQVAILNTLQYFQL